MGKSVTIKIRDNVMKEHICSAADHLIAIEVLKRDDFLDRAMRCQDKIKKLKEQKEKLIRRFENKEFINKNFGSKATN